MFHCYINFRIDNNRDIPNIVGQGIRHKATLTCFVLGGQKGAVFLWVCWSIAICYQLIIANVWEYSFNGNYKQQQWNLPHRVLARPDVKATFRAAETRHHAHSDVTVTDCWTSILYWDKHIALQRNAVIAKRVCGSGV